MVNSVDFSLSEQEPDEARAMLERVTGMSTADPVEVDEVYEADADGVPARVYEPNDAPATIVFFHGGGFVVGSLDTHDALCRLLTDRSGCASSQPTTDSLPNIRSLRRSRTPTRRPSGRRTSTTARRESRATRRAGRFRRSSLF